MHPEDPGSPLTEIEDEDLVSESEEDQTEPSYPTPEPQPKQRVPSGRQTRAQTAPELTITPYLSSPRTMNYNTSFIYDEMVEHRLDLNPEYQREVVWSDEKQSMLIDSLFHNVYIPPIIFSVQARRIRVCIDGKQRLTSIYRFMRGEIPLKDMGKKYYWPSANMGRKNPIPQALIEQFRGLSISTVEYDYLSEQNEREIFQRVQLGMALTPAERFIALNTPTANLVREIKRDLMDNIGDAVNWTHARGKDFSTLAQLVYLMSGNTANTEPTIKKLNDMLIKEDKVSPLLAKNVSAVVEIFAAIVHDKTLGIPLRRTKLVSLELLLILHMINLNRMKLSLTQLSDAISQFLFDVRKSKTMGKTPTAQYKLMIQWVKGLKVTNLASDNKGDMPAGRLRLPPLRPEATGDGPKSESKTRSTVPRSTSLIRDKASVPDVEAPKPKPLKRQHEGTEVEDEAQRERKRRTTANPPPASRRATTKASVSPQTAKKTPDPRRKKVATPASAPVVPSHPSGGPAQSPATSSRAPSSRARHISNPVGSHPSMAASLIAPSSNSNPVVSHPSMAVQSFTPPPSYPSTKAQPSPPLPSANPNVLSQHDRMVGLRQAHSQAKPIKREMELPASLSRSRGAPPTTPPQTPQLRMDSFAMSVASKRFCPTTADRPPPSVSPPLAMHPVPRHNNRDLMATPMSSFHPAPTRPDSYGRRSSAF